MGIRSVEAWQPIDANSPADWRTTFGQFAVRIVTEDGLTGCGVGGGGRAGMMVVESILAPLLIGRDPSRVEELWQRMYDATVPFGRKGIAVMALSGVDLALWDLRAKAAGRSVARLLSARHAPRVPTYNTVWGEVDEKTVAGSGGVKLHLHPPEPLTPATRAEFVESAVGGCSNTLLHQAGARVDGRWLDAVGRAGSARDRRARARSTSSESKNRCRRTTSAATGGCGTSAPCRLPAGSTSLRTSDLSR